MSLNVYMITLAEDAQNAASEVESWLDHYANREFFDSGELEEPEEIVLVSEILKELEDKKANVEKLLSVIADDIKKYRENNNRSMEGYSYKRYGRILDEDPCPDMPFFNISNWDWSTPTEAPDNSTGMTWYAVMAKLYC